jgi:hypothetical protein
MKSPFRFLSPSASSRCRSVCLSAGLAGWLLLLNPRAARAEDAVSYKYADYNEANGRIGVQTQTALIEKDFGPDMRLKLQGIVDAIAGASPNGQPAPTGSDQVPLATLHDRRKAWNADFSRQFSGFNFDLGVANSRESDYVSTGWSVNVLTDFNQKNTTLLTGLAGTDDDVKVFYQTPRAKKHTRDLILGATQLLDPNTSVTLNLSWGRATGYLNDQYKLVQKSIEVGPGVFLPFTFGENRPAERTRWAALVSLNHALPGLNAAIETSYRFYHDTFGTDAHTAELAWFQHAGTRLVFVPHLRFHDQTSADFYHYNLDATSIVPVAGAPRTGGPFYSSDYRLSALRSYNYGLKAVLTLVLHWQLDAGIERYEMRGRDSVTPQSAYPRADIVTVGAKFTW